MNEIQEINIKFKKIIPFQWFTGVVLFLLKYILLYSPIIYKWALLSILLLETSLRYETLIELGEYNNGDKLDKHNIGNIIERI